MHTDARSASRSVNMPFLLNKQKIQKLQAWPMKGQKLKVSGEMNLYSAAQRTGQRASTDMMHYKFSFNLGYCRPRNGKYSKVEKERGKERE